MSDIRNQVRDKHAQIEQLRKEIVSLAKSEGLREVEDYLFHDKDGNSVKLSELFNGHDELVIIHNMGKSCPYCTLWADGLSSGTPHFMNRCGFALVSPNPFDIMREFAASRGWQFPYLSASESTFIADMGFVVEKDGKNSYWPGFTTFVKQDAKIWRVASDEFGPGDFYAPIWHFQDMLHHADREWHPKFSYD